MKKGYDIIVKHYENCLEKFGDTHKGVDWPNEHDALVRYRVMLDLIRFDSAQIVNPSLLDFGCGTGGMLEYLRLQPGHQLRYAGLDISEKFVTVAKNKFPENIFYCIDVLRYTETLPQHDYVILNGVFTEKRELEFEEMLTYFKQMIKTVHVMANRGLSFNVMSKHVDWERGDLFHLPFDVLAEFLTKEVTRNFIIRSDYHLYEYTVYLYK